MATILRGKRKGETFKIHQFCNDWVTDWNNKVFNITSVEFTDKELRDIKAGNTGMMFSRFEIVGNRIKKRKAS